MTLVKQGTTTPIAATVAYTAATFKATLTPSAALTAATTYVARVKGGTGGIKDVAGNVLAADVTWTFTTAAAGGTTTLPVGPAVHRHRQRLGTGREGPQQRRAGRRRRRCR